MLNNVRQIETRSLTGAASRLALLAVVAFALASSASAQRAKSKRPAAQPRASAVVLEAEELLSGLGYWTGAVDGKMDAATRNAIIAFQKVEGRAATGKLTAAEMEAMRNARRPAPLEGGAPHIEVDLARQVLFVVDEGGVVSKVLPVSSGNGEEFTSEGWTRRAVTPTGRFKVHRKIDGKRKSPLGMLYYPNYFLSGVAIHGSPSVPTRPASHGCIRIPMFAAKPLHDLIPVGTTVLVHGDSSTFAHK
jgi:lipoprotein-anchoring transpeptidase ErfK/SrfK